MKADFIVYPFAVILGLVTGLITLFIIPSLFEIFVWLFLILIIGIYTHYQVNSNKYRKTFVIAVLTGIVITFTHLSFINQYLETHHEEIQMLDKILINNSYRLTLLIVAPIYWSILGVLSIGIRLVIEKINKTINPNR
jgi:hypothetical protein